MRTETYERSLDELETDLIVLPLFEEDRPPRGLCGLVDWRLNGFVSKLILDQRLSGRYQEDTLVPLNRRVPARRLLLMGMGQKKDFSLNRAREAGSTLGRKLGKLQCADAAVYFPNANDEKRKADTENTILQAVSSHPLPKDLRIRWLCDPFQNPRT